MPSLSYGLNLSKKSSARPVPAKRQPNLFDDDSDDAESQLLDPRAPQTLTSLDDTLRSTAKKSLSKTPLPPTRPPITKKAPAISPYGDLSARHTSNKHAAEAEALDPSIYDYDGVYDTLHAKPTKTTKPENSRPEYMSKLLAAAEIRKRDQLRAKEKLLAKERAAEGEEFEGKESFVTGAYKKQQEEMRLKEEEERRKEEEEGKRRGKGEGMKRFYKGVLEADEERHKAAVEAAADLARRRANGEVEEEKSEDKTEEQKKSEAELAKEKGVAVNDDGAVVDKRELLRAGLNVAGGKKDAGAGVKRPVPAEFSDNGRGGKRDRETRKLEDEYASMMDRAFGSDSDED